MYGFGYSIFKKVGLTPFYIMVRNPNPNNIFTLQTINPKISIVNTLVNKIGLNDYVLCLNVDIENDTISLLHYIKPQLLENISHIYTPMSFSNVEKYYTDDK